MSKYKKLATYVVLVATVGVFVWYVRTHPEVLVQLRTTSPLTVLIILCLYGCMTIVLAVLYRLMLDLCGVRIPGLENMLLTMYSSVVNFFGPLQSGPGFRMVYLKKRFAVSARAYARANIVYYVIFAVVSGAFLLSGLLGAWVIPLVIMAVSAGWVLLPYARSVPRIGKYIPAKTQGNTVAALAVMTAVQLLLVAIIYFVELNSLQANVSFGQAVVYAGAANFSLFVSLTPGALGFRESFLLLSRHLHHIEPDTIVSANIMDRAIYVLFLGLLFGIVLVMHGTQKLSKVMSQKALPPDEQ